MPGTGEQGFERLVKDIRQTIKVKEYNLAPYLPFLLSLQGQPYTLANYQVMEPLFATTVPWQVVYKCARQVSKSTSLAAQGLVQAATTPYFRSLYVLPLYEQCRRFSSNVLRPFVNESPIKGLIIDSGCEQSVLQKSFINHSIMYFTFAFLDCDRVRGIAADKLAIDEAQDMDWDFLPIIGEVLSASKWGIKQYSGTPKTFDNTLEALWSDSSQAEWFIPCGCGHWNIPAVQFDAVAMIGPVSNIKTHGTALVCGKCRKPIDATKGAWIHKYPERRIQFAGYHVPQIVMPLHYASDKKWTELLTKMNKRSNAVVMNEVLGESCDVGTKLVTVEELRRACILHKLDLEAAKGVRFTERYIQRILGVDWGGGGEDKVSYTTISIVGLRPDYKQEVLWAERLHVAVSDVDEVNRIIELFSLFSCHYIAHDFAGSGSVHETLLIQAGFPMNKIIPFSYVRTGGKSLIVHHSPDTGSIRHYYALDKTWSIMLLCMLVKTGHLMFPEYTSAKDLVDDFLHLVEHKTESPHAGDIMTVKRMPKQSDDFVHSTNFAVCAHFHTTQRYPDIADAFGLTLTDDQRNIAQPPGETTF